MIIDFHTHVFPDKIAQKTISLLASNSSNKPYSDGTVNGLREQLKRAKIDLAITLPVVTKPSQFEGINEFAQQLNKQRLPILSFGGIHPDCENLPDKMVQLKQMGFRGVKIHPDYQSTFFDDDKYLRILECAKKLDLIVVTHAGVDGAFLDQPVRCTPSRALNALNQVKNVKLVLAHLGANLMTDEVFDLLLGQNVYFDTAFCLRDVEKVRFQKMVALHGANKILFATDSPWRDIQEELSILSQMELTKEENKAILGKNAKNLLKI